MVPTRTLSMRQRWSGCLAVLAVAVSVGGCAERTIDRERPSAIDPTSRYERMMNGAEEARRAGDLSGAAGFYEMAHVVAPDRVPPLIGLGETAAAAGATDKAARYFRQAVTIAPEDVAARRGYGAVLLALDAPAEAERQYRAAIAIDPLNPIHHNGLAVSLDLQGAHEEAQLAYDQGLQRSRNHLSLQNNKALSLAVSGAYEEAIGMLSRLAGAPGASNPRVRQNLALVYALAGRTNEAMAVARQDLSERDARNNLALYESLRGLGGRALAEAVFHGSVGRAPIAPEASELEDAGEETAMIDSSAAPAPVVAAAAQRQTRGPESEGSSLAYCPMPDESEAARPLPSASAPTVRPMMPQDAGGKSRQRPSAATSGGEAPATDQPSGHLPGTGDAHEPSRGEEKPAKEWAAAAKPHAKPVASTPESAPAGPAVTLKFAIPAAFDTTVLPHARDILAAFDPAHTAAPPPTAAASPPAADGASLPTEPETEPVRAPETDAAAEGEEFHRLKAWLANHPAVSTEPSATDALPAIPSAAAQAPVAARPAVAAPEPEAVGADHRPAAPIAPVPARPILAKTSPPILRVSLPPQNPLASRHETGQDATEPPPDPSAEARRPARTLLLTLMKLLP